MAEKNGKNGSAKAVVKVVAKAKPRTKGLQAEDGEVVALGQQRVLEDDGEEYHDQESEWEDQRFASEESEAHAVFKDFTGGLKGISGKTDLTQDQFVFLWHLRNMEKDFTERGMLRIAAELREAAEQFETYRLSVGRKSRTETVDLFRGKMELAKKDAGADNPLRF